MMNSFLLSIVGGNDECFKYIKDIENIDLLAKDSRGVCLFLYRSALLIACEYQRIEMVDYLLHQCSGFDVNEHDNEGITPLHIAAMSCSNKLLSMLLLEESIKINVLDNKGIYPLYISIQKEDEENTLLFLNHQQCDQNIKTYQGVYLLFLYCSSSYCSCIRTKENSQENNTKEKY
ncbi:hypothetical protein TRFO_21355 [Tritrichomonas foetus]|uniref:Uncharacterized protein n=1 Tax=Tritrichomonas foetus TaxID=1144522 RepID=A0A1J4KIK0_9EUKA|nr:hypothetical protein TRFO_21355 [Tritrichomonas foetus]|eukprot:OHT09644.1 hypothetical protein TRFO_21355 [Tritrichomonas foetus]